MDKKVAVITGASKGIGKALAVLLLKEGHAVVNISHSPPESETDAVFIQADVRSQEACDSAIQKTIADFGRIDVLVNNAGVLIPDSVEHLDTEKMRANMETNVYGTLYCSHAVIPQMKKQGHGQILNMASTSGMSFRPGNVSYAASKWAVVGMTGTLRKEVESYGIDVVCFSPGGVKTELHRHDPGRDTSDYMDSVRVAEKMLEVLKRTDKDKWLFVIKRGEKNLHRYGFDEYPGV